MSPIPPRPAIAVTMLLCTLLVAASAAVPLAVADSEWNGSRWDASRWDASRWDGSRWDGSQWDGSQWDASRWDASRWDGSQWDASRWDASRWDASRWDASEFDGYDPLYPYQWGHRASNVPGAWERMGPGDGSVTICVLDSGVDYTHRDLASRMWTSARGTHGYDFVDGDDDPMDIGGHGTHVASIAAAASGDGYGVAGVANAQVMAVRIIGPDGMGTDADLVLGIHYCVDNGARILSMSLSTVEDVKVVASAINYAVVNGAVVIASAGNVHCEACHSPLVKLKGVVTVAAVGPDGDIAPFATWGADVDLGAPGMYIAGAIPGGGFVQASGSSQAVPYVSGAAALLLMRNPSLTNGDVADILVDTAQITRQTSYGPLRVLDVDAAISRAYEGATGTEFTIAHGEAPSLEIDAQRPAPIQTRILRMELPTIQPHAPPLAPPVSPLTMFDISGP